MLWARQSTTVCTLRVVPGVNDDERDDCDGRWRCRQLLVEESFVLAPLPVADSVVGSDAVIRSYFGRSTFQWQRIGGEH